MYLAGKMGLFDKRGYSSRVFIVAMPLLLATLVSISRVDDYQHRWVDIIFAALLGGVPLQLHLLSAVLNIVQHYLVFYSVRIHVYIYNTCNLTALEKSCSFSYSLI
jgi:hypothetical protein